MNIEELLNAPGCERIKDFYAVGPVQRAAVESLIDAAQAQQTTEPELPEPIGYLSVHTVEGPFKYQFNKERAAVYPDNAISIDAVFTATQMHDHYQAGVRAGAAQQQAIQRGIDKILADPVKHGLDLGEKQ